MVLTLGPKAHLVANEAAARNRRICSSLSRRTPGLMKFRQSLGWSFWQALTKIPCRGKVSVDTFPNFCDWVVGRDNIPESPDGEKPVCLRGYSVDVGSSVKIEVTTGMLIKPSTRNPNTFQTNLPEVWYLSQRLVGDVVRREPKPIDADQDMVWKQLRRSRV